MGAAESICRASEHVIRGMTQKAARIKGTVCLPSVPPLRAVCVMGCATPPELTNPGECRKSALLRYFLLKSHAASNLVSNRNNYMSHIPQTVLIAGFKGYNSYISL